MKILLSPAKEMNTDTKVFTQIDISEITNKIIENLNNLDNSQLKNKLKINDNILKLVKSYLSNMKNPGSNMAIHTYNGLAYRSMDRNFSNKDLTYMTDNCLILSALYGPISPTKYIKPYRLDFMNNLKIDGYSLKSLWKPFYNQSIEGQDFIINLASNEFSSLFNREKNTWIDFDFYEEKNGKLKMHSTISKKARGLMFSYLVHEKIEDLDLIKKFKSDGYRYVESLSNKNKYVFIKNN